jgi:hypothetical protein
MAKVGLRESSQDLRVVSEATYVPSVKLIVVL